MLEHDEDAVFLEVPPPRQETSCWLFCCRPPDETEKRKSRTIFGHVASSAAKEVTFQRGVPAYDEDLSSFHGSDEDYEDARQNSGTVVMRDTTAAVNEWMRMILYVFLFGWMKQSSSESKKYDDPSHEPIPTINTADTSPKQPRG